MKNYVIAHAPTSRILLALGYILMFWSTSECFGAPPVLTGAAMNLLDDDTRDDSSWQEHLCGPNAKPYVRLEPQPCPLCAASRKCMAFAAVGYQVLFMNVVLFLGFASAVLHPYRMRTKKTYGRRLVIIVLPFCFALLPLGAFVIIGLLFHLLLISTRKRWHPMPSDEPTQ
ncbi:hypothetical protein KDL45_11010 [bacterium]|nr:hypothetical protein [bacterium]MCB9476200.1 hypothetical protein [Deltaproteobacteria bacterium]MCB9479870.1 hypothetical protein [Deltaproteobacteria bacterium]